jgi:hypothetical protein
MIGNKVIFPNNEFPFFQDFSFWIGIPSNIEFTVIKESVHDDYWLEGKGYGLAGDYGSGRICVRTKYIKPYLIKEIDNA